MSDAIYVLLTLAVFIALALLVGVLDRHSVGSPESRPELAPNGPSDGGNGALDGGAR